MSPVNVLNIRYALKGSGWPCVSKRSIIHYSSIVHSLIHLGDETWVWDEELA